MTVTSEIVSQPTDLTGAPTAPPRRRGWRRKAKAPEAPRDEMTAAPAETIEVSVEPDDPLIDVLLSATGPVDIDDLPAFSPAVRQMRESDVRLVVPLVASGELVGLLALGERRSERGYSRDDRKLLENLAQHAAPALRVGQLVREQEQEARERQRIESELQVAQLIQQNFLPAQLPEMNGWQVDAFYRPARTVGGDFYDVVEVGDGRVMVVTGDVTDKGVPAALVMASTHALLRAAAKPGVQPGQVLAEVNNLLHPQIPIHMFVTCLILILDPRTGAASFANAGHNLPYLRRDGHVTQLHARGMPLGLMPGSQYEEHTTVIEPGDIVVLYSDGITEQHNADGEMYDFERMAAVVAASRSGAEVVDECMSSLMHFSANCEQEDDITLVAVSRPESGRPGPLRFSVPSVSGNERDVMDRVVAFIGDNLPPARLAALGTAVSETAMNAIEHGNGEDPEALVDIEVTRDPDVIVAIRDRGKGPQKPAETPDLDLKLAGQQSARGWGLFLVQSLVDEVREENTDTGHTVYLTISAEGDTP